MVNKKFLSFFVALFLASVALATDASACTKQVVCGPVVPETGDFRGTEYPKMIQVEVCLQPDLWAAIGQTWWGEALADTGRPNQRWLALDPVEAMCRTRFVVPGARVGTRVICPSHPEYHNRWYWTEAMDVPGERYYIRFEEQPAPAPVNPGDLPAEYRVLYPEAFS